MDGLNKHTQQLPLQRSPCLGDFSLLYFSFLSYFFFLSYVSCVSYSPGKGWFSIDTQPARTWISTRTGHSLWSLGSSQLILLFVAEELLLLD